MAYDQAIGRVVLFGGADSATHDSNETWTYDGTTWIQEHPATSPPGRAGAAMAYDQAIGRIVLFGGITANNQEYNDTWIYDGDTWIQQRPATSPPARGAMAFDPAIGRLVLFGGGGERNETWTYDESTWKRESPANSPPPKASVPMTYDASLGKLLLYNGATWTYDGTTWTRQSTSGMTPQVTYGMSIAYDPAIGRTVLFGGESSPTAYTRQSQGYEVNDTWIYDGTQWTRQYPSNAPTARTSAPMTYDPGLRSLVLFDGIGPGLGQPGATGTPPPQTWTYGPVTGAREQ